MMSNHERNETLTFAAIALSFAAAMLALSVTSERTAAAERERADRSTASAAPNATVDQAG